LADGLGGAAGSTADLGAGDVSGAADTSLGSDLSGGLLGGGDTTGGFFDPSLSGGGVGDLSGGFASGSDMFGGFGGTDPLATGGLGGNYFGSGNTFDPSSGQTVSPAENLGQQQSIPQGTQGL